MYEGYKKLAKESQRCSFGYSLVYVGIFPVNNEFLVIYR